MADEGSDGVFEFFGGAVNAPPELLFCERGEPAFDQIEPRGRGRREVEMEARSLGQPVADCLRFVGAVVVEDGMNVQF